jgi:K+-sensing histidine kinase KdpD
VHIVPSERHLVVGLFLGVGGSLVVTLALSPLRDRITTASPAMLLVVPVVGAALFGGRIAAAVTAAAAALALASGFLPPIGSPRVSLTDDVVALVVFIVVAVVIGELMAVLVETEQRRATSEAARIEALERTDQQRAALLRSVSHDLRTPLATIQAVASDLASGTAWDDGTRAEMLELVCDEAERLDRLVANLLSMSRIEAGASAPDRQPVDVADVVATCVHRLRRLVRDVPLVLEIGDDLPLVDGDPSQLDQVVTNLVENAVRHSPPGEAVRVRVALDGDSVRVTVADAGPGIAPERRRVVFEPFGGAGGPGTGGLGLAICRSFVEAHGGTVGVADAPGGGAELSFTLPVRIAVARGAP